MKHYIILTDTNSRQYLYEIISTFSIKTEQEEFLVTVENPNISKFAETIDKGLSITIDNKAVFNSNHIVAVQYQSWPDDAH
nr:MAG: hypothetical protein [Caudoviricetes sp.]